MAIQDFTAGQILTAAQMDSLQANDYNQTVSTKTVSYTLVAADKGTRVVMNAAGATTITVNTSVFAAGDTLFIQNIGAGVCTVTAGTATVSSTSSLSLTQNAQGLLYFTSTGVSIFYPTAIGWQTYTPTFTNFTLGNGTVTAKFSQTGKLVTVLFEVVLGTTSSMSTNPIMTLPVTATTLGTLQLMTGFAFMADFGVNNYFGAVEIATSTSVNIRLLSVSGAVINRGNITSTAPFTWGSTDVFNGLFYYEAA